MFDSHMKDAGVVDIIEIKDRALPNGHYMSPSWAILLEAIHAMFNLKDVTLQC